MKGISDKFSRFRLELKRRKTDRVVVLYAAAAFIILQLSQILSDSLSLPEWTMTLIIIILAVGFPVAAVFSWFFDITPGGIEKTQPLTAKKRQKIQSQLRAWKGTTMISFIVIIALIIFNIVSKRIEVMEIKRTTKSIAVIPFENLSSDQDMQFVSTGITSIITTGLSEIKDLEVAPRITVLQYLGNSKSVFEIAKKLKVLFIVTGDLVKNKDQVIINVNLMTVKKEKVLWAKHYAFDREENIDLKEMTEITSQIVKTLSLVLSPEDKRRIRKKPTSNATAYMSFLSGNNSQDDADYGNAYISMGDSTFKDLTVSSSFHKALDSYDKAIRADSTFALAYAKRAITRSWGFNAGHLTAKEDKEKCWNDIVRALQLDENLTEAWIASGFYYYYFEQDSSMALGWFRKVLKKEPDNWRSKYYMALVLRANSEWNQSQKLMAEVGRSNPNDALVLTNIGMSYDLLHSYDTAIYYHDKAIRIFPRWTGPYTNKIHALLLRDGNTIEADAVMDTALAKTSGMQLQVLRILLDIYNGRINEALFKADIIDDSEYDSKGEKYLLFAQIYNLMKNKDFARESYKLAYDFYGKIAADKTENTIALSLKGIAAAGINEKTNAVEWGQKAVALTGKKVFVKNEVLINLAKIYVMVGDFSNALKLIEELFSNPSDLSTGILKLDPVWKPLADKPNYRELIIKYSHK
jgi:TolB-like protein/tetratricopeptide (TPR) repeat protein